MIAWLASPFSIICLTATVALAIVSLLWFGWRVPLGIVLTGIGILAGLYKVVSIPLPDDISLPRPAQVFDRDGELIGSYSDVRRTIIDTKTLPPHVEEAVVAAEDRTFFEHGGVSIPGLIRASLVNLRSRSIMQGGSTITQQYVKNAVLNDDSRTLVRKLNEAVLAVKLEDLYPKNQIMDFYLNTIYFGRGTYGIEAASQDYFSKNAAHLDLQEAAFLAGIIRSPERLQPDRRPAAAKHARDRVLDAMAEEGFISRRKAASVTRTPLSVASRPGASVPEVHAPFFMDWLRREVLEPRFGDCLYTCGLHIHTTLDLDIQRHAEDAVTEVLGKRGDPEGALVAMTPKGEVLAFVGRRPRPRTRPGSRFDLASGYPGRHAGSALKPFTLIAALEQGFSSGTQLSGSSPHSVREEPCGQNREPWRVSNYGGASYGGVSLASATAASVNTAYAQLAQRVGPVQIADVLGRFGFDRAQTPDERKIPRYCSLALGALDVTPLEMARAYAGIAGEGVLPQVLSITQIIDGDGRCALATRAPKGMTCDEMMNRKGSKAAEPAVAADTTSILRGVMTHGTGAGAALPVPASGKTGTSQNNTDAWFAGYTDQLVSSVWVGYPARRNARVPQMRFCKNQKRCRPVDGAEVTGGTLPARIWATFMRRALAELGDLEDPVTSGGPGAPPFQAPGSAPPKGRPRPQEPDDPAPEPPPPPPTPPSGPLPGLPAPKPTR